MRLNSKLQWGLGMLAFMLAGTVHGQGSGPDLRPVGRQLAAEHNDAILIARIVMSIGKGSQTRERKSENNITILQPDGLAVISLEAIDPVSMYRQMSGGDDDEEGGGVESRVKDLKYVMPDKKEVPATIVLRDADLNIALLRPLNKPDKPMKFINLKNAGDASMLDPFVSLARLGPIADRQISAQTGIIEAVVAKPRKFYIPGGSGSLNGLAVPAFNEGGKILGMIVLRTQSGGDGMGGMGGGNQNVVPIILPAEDIAEVAAQAPMEGEKLGAPAKGDEKTTGTAKTKKGEETKAD